MKEAQRSSDASAGQQAQHQRELWSKVASDWNVCYGVPQEKVLLCDAQGSVQSGSKRFCSTCWSSGRHKLLGAQGKEWLSSRALAGLPQVCLQHPVTSALAMLRGVIVKECQSGSFEQLQA